MLGNHHRPRRQFRHLMTANQLSGLLFQTCLAMHPQTLGRCWIRSSTCWGSSSLRPFPLCPIWAPRTAPVGFLPQPSGILTA